MYKIIVHKPESTVSITGFASYYLAEVYARENNLKNYTIQQETDNVPT